MNHLHINRRRTCLHLLTLGAATVLAGCATPPPAQPAAEASTPSGHWSGRLALQVASEPPQSLFAGFVLEGAPQAGQLSLTSPLGNTLAHMRWTPGQAWLQQGDVTKPYASLDDMIEQATGAPLPVAALFAWLHGQAQDVPGWQADLSQLPQGRLRAQRLMPLPTAELRIVLDQP